ncbi:MAG: SLBB domain-containing protein [Ignavibacteriaceae bacterium]|nr:SLBB domain-containing protein [Ignavibacteriaceae bacterium]MCW9065928.1 SLBB domain-containing protein [Ignavibacteriaceae bacterium]
MNIKSVICFLVLFYLTAYPQFTQNQISKSDMKDIGTISVTIGGSFPINGTYPAFITDRLDEFISRMYAEAVDLTMRVTSDPDIYRKLKAELDNFALRGIKLKRATGEEVEVDLQKFRMTGDFTYNPYLKNDDVIIFPSNDTGRNFFAVYGAVNFPGTFYFVEGDNLGDALELVGGINSSYNDVSNVEVSRLSYDGQSETKITIGIDEEFPIQRGDRFRFLAFENQKRNFSVTVIGEVNIPGVVPITRDNTTLYEVIQSCDGFTPYASLRRARVYSKNSLAMLLERQYGINLGDQPDLEDPKVRNLILNLELAMMYRMSNVVEDDSTYFNLENQLRVLVEGSSLDFNKITDPESDIAKYKVKNGDLIIVPVIQNSIYVFGQVLRPGYVTYIEGKDYEYYVNEASGLGELAEEGDIMIIKGGSRAWISVDSDSVTIEEGDYIYVPKENLRSTRSYILEYAVYLSVLASIAAILLSVVTIANQ